MVVLKHNRESRRCKRTLSCDLLVTARISRQHFKIACRSLEIFSSHPSSRVQVSLILLVCQYHASRLGQHNRRGRPKQRQSVKVLLGRVKMQDDGQDDVALSATAPATVELCPSAASSLTLKIQSVHAHCEEHSLSLSVVADAVAARGTAATHAALASRHRVAETRLARA